ncbi:hypothetical protein HOY82DRAFT_599573 [Tuber indicum]|nr:hypothetical protein HOY82DRAFT_599573 [Tuber indicum]
MSRNLTRSSVVKPSKITDPQPSKAALDLLPVMSTAELSTPDSDSSSQQITPPKETSFWKNYDQPCPFQPILSEQYCFYERLTIWSDRSQKQWQALDNKWHELLKEKNLLITEKNEDIVKLTVMALNERMEGIKLRGAFNICGALELLVYHAIVIKKIDHVYEHGIQSGLDKIAHTTEFIAALDQEVRARHLLLQEVTAGISHIYYEVSKKAAGNDKIVTLHAQQYTTNQVAVLAAFLSVQGHWWLGHDWIEENNGKELVHDSWHKRRYFTAQ